MADFRRDSAGIAEILKTNCRAIVDEAARAIAANVDGDATVEYETTDRARATVVVKGRNAVGRQARDGILTRAAAAAGLEVVSYQ